jgi:hypothetical protein
MSVLDTTYVTHMYRFLDMRTAAPGILNAIYVPHCVLCMDDMYFWREGEMI